MCVSVLHERIPLYNPYSNECSIQVLRKSFVLLVLGVFVFVFFPTEEPKNRLGSVSVVNANFVLCQIYGLFISERPSGIHRAACFLAWLWGLPSTSCVANV